MIRKYLSGRHLGCAVLLLLVVGAVYHQAVFFDFLHFDDPQHVSYNELIKSLDVSHIVSIFKQLVLKTYIPLTTLSFAVEYKFFGLNPFYFHLDNILLHLIVTLLVFRIGLTLGLSLLSSFVASLLFGIHPMHVPSVVWVTERKDVLYSVFYLMSVLSWINFNENKKKKFYWFSLISGLLSMLAKSMAVSLPLMLLLLDWFKNRQDIKKCLIEKIPFLIILVGLAAITHRENYAAFEIHKNIFSAALIFIWTFTFYINAFIWPFHLCPIYRTQEPVDLTNGVYISALISFILLIVVIFKFRKSKWFVFAFMTYIVMIFFLFRFGLLYGDDVVADRFMYLPSMGFCFLFGLGLARLLMKLKKSFLLYTGVILSAICVLGILIFQNLAYSSRWSDNFKLWDFVIKRDPNSRKAFVNRGVFFLQSGRYTEALSDFNQALILDPSYSHTYIDRGATYVRMDQDDLAIKDFTQALIFSPSDTEAHFNRAVIYRKIGNIDAALEDYNWIIQHDKMAEAFYNRGVLLMEQGQADQALEDFTQTILLKPQLESAYTNRMHLNFKAKKYVSVLQDLEQLIKLNPTNENYQFQRQLILKLLNNKNIIK